MCIFVLKFFQTTLENLGRVLLFLLLTSIAPTWAVNIDQGEFGHVTLNAEPGVVDLAGLPQYIDTTETMSLAEVREQAFSPGSEKIHFPKMHEAIWQRFSIERPKGASAIWFLEFQSTRAKDIVSVVSIYWGSRGPLVLSAF